MNGRRSKRQTEIEANPPVPLASYGIKIHGREYRAWPSRYNTIFDTVLGRTCDCSTAGALHFEYRLVMHAIGYETELPSTVDGEDIGENTQRARDIQKRAISLYQETIGSKESNGPGETSWRLDLESRVFGRFGQSSPQESTRGLIGKNSSPALLFDRARRQSVIDLTNSSPLQRFTTDRPDTNAPAASSNMTHTPRSSPGPALDESGRRHFMNSSTPGESSRGLANSIPSHTRSSSFCSTPRSESSQQPYFVSATEKFILEDDLGLQARQEEKKPDRIIGLALRNTPYAYPGRQQRDSDIQHRDIRDLKLKKGINLSPFRDGDFSTMILPFVIFEGKSARGTYWPELETQTALPVAKLLRLQINLQSATGKAPKDCNTLVWMFGAIGPEWRVYGCYAVWFNGNKELSYGSFYRIVQLASMDVRVEKEAVRLLNIVDSIVLWGHTFRRSVIEDINKIEI